MNWQEALKQIQSVELDVNLNVVSSSDAFFEVVARESAVLDAYALMRESGELREEALGKISDLVWTETDPSYENPNDTPLAVLLWLTNFAANDFATIAAGWVDQAPRCWHAKKLAQRILNPPPSTTGTMSENPNNLLQTIHVKNRVNTSIGGELVWAHTPRLEPGSRIAFPAKGSSTLGVNWENLGVAEVEQRDGTK